MDSPHPAHQATPYYQLEEEKSAGGPVQFQQQNIYRPAYDAEPSQPHPAGTRLDNKRGIVLAVLSLILILLGLVIGLGAGLGVTQRNLSRAKTDLKAIESLISSTSTAIPIGYSLSSFLSYLSAKLTKPWKNQPSNTIPHLDNSPSPSLQYQNIIIIIIQTISNSTHNPMSRSKQHHLHGFNPLRR